jgi:hypothetical protein
VAHDRTCFNHDAPASGVDPPAEIDVVAVGRPGRVKAAEVFPDIAPDQRGGGAHRQHLVDIVALTLVQLDAVETRVNVPGRVNGESGLKQPGAIPGAHLGSDEPHRRRVRDPDKQLIERGRVRGAVVVKEPDPFDDWTGTVVIVIVIVEVVGAVRVGVVRVAVEARRRPDSVVLGNPRVGVDGSVDRLPERSLARQRQHAVRANCGRDQRQRVVRARGVGADEQVGRSSLRRECVKYLGQPTRAVVADQYSGYAVARMARAGRRLCHRLGVFNRQCRYGERCPSLLHSSSGPSHVEDSALIAPAVRVRRPCA